MVLPLAALTATLSVASAQPPFGLPKPKLPGVDIKIPGLDKILKQEEAVSTSLADAFQSVPYLDDYDPQSVSPMAELPMDDSFAYLRLPGLYELPAQSFCMKAGTFPPSLDRNQFQGAGYLYAPLKGPKSGIMAKLLNASVTHPEIPQHGVQLIIWALIAQSKPSDWPQAMEQTARKILSEKDMRDLEGNALAVIPPEHREKVWGKLPEPVRFALEAENRLRETLREKASKITAPMTEANERLNEPGNRLSGQMGEFYNEMERTAMRVGIAPPIPPGDQIHYGRWNYHNDGYFLRLMPRGYSFTLRQVYHPERFTVERDSEGRLISLQSPYSGRAVFTYQGKSPESAKVSLAVPGGGFGGETNVRATAGRSDFNPVWDSLNKGFTKAVSGFGKGANSARLRDDLRDLAALRAAFRESAPAHDLIARAWMSAFAEYASGEKALAYAPLPVPENAYRVAANAPLRRAAAQWSGGGFGGDGGGGAGMPPPGRQRLGQSNGKSPDSADKAKDGINAINKMGKVAKVQAIPLGLATRLANWICDTGGAAARALGGDPPRPDFKIYSQPEGKNLPPIAWGNDVSPKRRAAIEAFLQAHLALNAELQAGVDSMDRLGGAKQAKDAQWTYGQAAAVVHYKSRAGARLLDVAEKADALATVLNIEGIGEDSITAEQIAAWQNRIRTQGYPPEHIAAARQLGLSDATIQTHLEKEREEDYSDIRGTSFVQALKEYANSLRQYGGHFGQLPAVELPK
ncbi:MAG: hypothetical protein OHK0029_24630 [Armatimonadaceae bacterium]